MNTFTNVLKELKEFNSILDNIKSKNTPVQITGCIDSQKCHLINGLGENYKWKVIITHNELKAKEIYEDYQLFDKNVFLYPAKDIIFYSADIHGNAIVNDRLKILRRLIENKPTTIITTLDGGMDKILPFHILEENKIKINENSSLDLMKLAEKLVEMGYERQGQVERPGEFAIRGGILDVFSATEEGPIRIELWGDEVDSIRYFDAYSQRSIESVEEVTIYPASEFILDKKTIRQGFLQIEKEKKEYVEKLRSNMKTEEAFRIDSIINEFKENLESFQGSVGINSYIQYFYDDTVSLFDYFDKDNSLIFIDEPNRVVERGQGVELEFRESMISRIEKGYILPSQSNSIFSHKELLAKLNQKNLLLISTMDVKQQAFTIKEKWDFTVRSMNPYNNNFELLVEDLKEWKKNGYRVLLLSSSNARAMRLSESLREHDLNSFYTQDLEREIQNSEIMVSSGSLHNYFRE